MDIRCNILAKHFTSSGADTQEDLISPSVCIAAECFLLLCSLQSTMLLINTFKGASVSEDSSIIILSIELLHIKSSYDIKFTIISISFGIGGTC